MPNWLGMRQKWAECPVSEIPHETTFKGRISSAVSYGQKGRLPYGSPLPLKSGGNLIEIRLAQCHQEDRVHWPDSVTVTRTLEEQLLVVSDSSVTESAHTP